MPDDASGAVSFSRLTLFAFILTAFLAASMVAPLFEGAIIPLSRLIRPSPRVLFYAIDIWMTLAPPFAALLSLPLLGMLVRGTTLPASLLRATAVLVGGMAVIWVLVSSFSATCFFWPPRAGGSMIRGWTLYGLMHLPLLPVALLAFRDTGRLLAFRAVQVVAALNMAHWCVNWFYGIANRPKLWTFWAYMLLSAALLAVSHLALAASRDPATRESAAAA